LLDTSGSPRSHANYATEIDQKFSRASLPELAAHKTPESWSLESRELAIEKGYLHGQLQGSTNAEAAPSLPEGYTKAAKAVAERQGALAGYRLADEIQKYLKSGKVVPLLPEAPNVVARSDIPKKIGTADASKFYDEDMTVTGKVAQVSIRPTVAFLNLDQAGPNSPFTAIIFQDNLVAFGDLQKFKDRQVEISGTITEYHGKPEIILESTNQVKVVGEK
jgi:hypothetical protein